MSLYCQNRAQGRDFRPAADLVWSTSMPTGLRVGLPALKTLEETLD